MNARRFVMASLLAIAGGCATEGTVGVAYDAWYYDPWYDWYGYGGGGAIVCCVDYPDVGPPHPEHPIAGGPGVGDRPKPANPIANNPQPKASAQPSTRSMSSPRPAAMPRGGGGMRGGGGRR